MTATIDDQRPAAAGTMSAAVGEHEAHVLVQRLHATMDELQQLDPTWLGDAGLVDILHEYERFGVRAANPHPAAHPGP